MIEFGRPMAEAPKDRQIIVWAPGKKHGLSDMFCKVTWHPDAGFCVCQLREPERWWELDEIKFYVGD